MTMKRRRKCFVIMPFSQTTKEHTKNYWDNHFEKFLKPLIESVPEFEAERSKAIRGDIIRQIITDLVTSTIVVADLTDSNPNVYWELGVRQSFKHGTITIVEHGTKLASDVAAKGTLSYHPKDHIANEEFRKDFVGAIRDCGTNPDKPDSQVLETISGRGTLYQILSRDETIRKLDALASETAENRVLLNVIEKKIQENIEARKEKKRVFYITGRFRCPSVELLIVSRYVDATASFYKVAEGYFDEIQQWNDQLSLWEKTEIPTEEWFQKVLPNFKKRIKELETLIAEHIKKTRESL